MTTEYDIDYHAIDADFRYSIEEEIFDLSLSDIDEIDLP